MIIIIDLTTKTLSQNIIGGIGIINLADYGFLPQSYMIHTEGTYARVTAVHKESYNLITEHGECRAILKSSVYFNNCTEEFPTTGDFVEIQYNKEGHSLIIKTLKRKSKFSRNDFSGHGVGYVKTIKEQTVAANFDYVFIMQSLNYDLNLKRLERYLTQSWQSGVGKSSLVNALADKEVMSVKVIREDDSKGKHTTTHRQLIKLDSGVMIIDTPGMRELGIWNVSEGISESFSDVEEFLGQCKFSDCMHQREPGCGIKAAIENGSIAIERWESYLTLKKEAAFVDNKASYLRSKEQQHVSVKIWERQKKKGGSY